MAKNAGLLLKPVKKSLWMGDSLDGLRFRDVEHGDLEELIAMLRDDELGRKREHPDGASAACYQQAFQAIADHPWITIISGEMNGRIVSCAQFTLEPGLARQGAWRARIEAVRVHRQERGSGVGQAMIRFAIAQARAWDCQLIELTSDKSRAEAIRFYQRLGFEASHEGMKILFK